MSLAEYQTRLHEAFQKAGGVRVSHTVHLGGQAVRFAYASPALADQLHSALAHHPTASQPDLRSTSGKVARCRRRRGLVRQSGARGDVELHDANVRACLHPFGPALSLIDLGARRGFHWVAPGALPQWVRYAPFLSILHTWLQQVGIAVVHAAAVGNSRGGLLLGGPGGAGKSTTAVQCLLVGMRYVGDDYCLVQVDPPYVYSLYGVAKLNRRSLDRVAWPYAAEWDGDDKAALHLALEPTLRARMAEGLPLRAVLLPRIGTGPRTALSRVTPAVALRHLAPSTLLQLSGAGQQTLATLAELLRRIPSYAIELGSDAGQLVDSLETLVAWISAIIAVLNGERFLAQAIESVLRQDVSDWELLVIDAGSTDATAAIAQGFSEVRYVKQQTPGGVAQAWNEGIAAAQGNLLTFLSHDDLWVVDKLHVQRNYLADNPEVHYVVGQATWFLEPGRTPPAGFRQELLSGAHAARIPETLMVRRHVLDRVGWFDTTYRISEDVDWFLRAQDAGARGHMLPQILVRKRLHGHHLSLTDSANSHLLRALRASIVRRRS